MNASFGVCAARRWPGRWSLCRTAAAVLSADGSAGIHCLLWAFRSAVIACPRPPGTVDVRVRGRRRVGKDAGRRRLRSVQIDFGWSPSALQTGMRPARAGGSGNRGVTRPAATAFRADLPRRWRRSIRCSPTSTGLPSGRPISLACHRSPASPAAFRPFALLPPPAPPVPPFTPVAAVACRHRRRLCLPYRPRRPCTRRTTCAAFARAFHRLRPSRQGHRCRRPPPDRPTRRCGSFVALTGAAVLFPRRRRRYQRRRRSCPLFPIARPRRRLLWKGGTAGTVVALCLRRHRGRCSGGSY